MTAAEACAPAIPRVLEVREVIGETPAVTTIRLNAHGTVRPKPGQFAMLYAFGVGEAAISYSEIDPDGPGVGHTIRAAGSVSSALAGVRPGECIGVRGPFGCGWPMAQAAAGDAVFVAGGLGLAPLRPAIRAVLGAPGGDRNVVVMYGARAPEHLLYAAELDAWRDAGAQVLTTVDFAAPGWTGHVGLVTALAARARFRAGEAAVFICGPEVMMRFAAAALLDLGCREDRIWLSMERNMKCALGHCGHCQFGPAFICKDGPVLRFDRVRRNLLVREI